MGNFLSVRTFKARQSVLLQKFFLWAFFQLSLIFMESPLRL